MLKKFINKYPDASLLCCCLFTAAMLALHFGQDKFWDLQNYHIYTPYAFLTGRMETDIIPAGVHTFFNPIPDLLYYLCIKYFNSLPRLGAALQSIWLGISFFFLIKITRLIIPSAKIWAESLLVSILFLFAPGTYGWCTQTTGDMMSAAFILASIYVFFLFIDKQNSPKRNAVFFLAGALLGTGFFMKYTSGPFVLAYGFMLLFAFRSFKDFAKCCSIFSLGFITALLLVGGKWLWMLYSNFGSPMFPFYNNIFKSPWFEPVALVDPRFFIKKTWVDFLILPFANLHFINMYIIEVPMRSVFFAAYWVCGVFLAVKLFWDRKLNRFPFNKKLIFLTLIFCLVGYIAWAKLFLIIRYLMPVEAMAAILVFAALKLSIKGRRRYLYMAFICAAMAFYTRGPKEMSGFDEKMIVIQTLAMKYGEQGAFSKEDFEDTSITYPVVEDGAVVILTGWKLSYLIPFMNPNATYVGGILPNPDKYSFTDGHIDILHSISFDYVFFKHKFTDKILEKIKKADSVYVLISSNGHGAFFLEPIYHYGVKTDTEQCQLIRTNMDYPAWLCRAEKL